MFQKIKILLDGSHWCCIPFRRSSSVFEGKKSVVYNNILDVMDPIISRWDLSGFAAICVKMAP